MEKAKYATKKEIKEALDSDFKELEKIAYRFDTSTKELSNDIPRDPDASYFISGIEESYSTSCHYKK